MLYRKVVPVFSLCFLALAHGMPQNTDNGQGTAGLPFIQFTNGGIRFNFAGYHAQAGLGGLLGGTRTEGGLHASAGTPWGAHAGAGLGGLLGGDSGNAGGGLYARAGLGNGRPGAAAGLGGLLDGSGRSNSPVSGGLFAGATTGTHGVGVASGSAAGGSFTGNDGPNGANGGQTGDGKDGGKPGGGSGGSGGGGGGGGGTNIQIISKKPQKVKQVVIVPAGPTEAPKQTDPPANKEVREIQSSEPVAAVSAGLYGAVSVNPGPGVTRTVEKVKIIGGPTVEQTLVNGANGVNEVAQIDARPHRVRIVYPKLVVRKRFWGPRKQIVYDTSVETHDASGSNYQKRQAVNYGGNAPPQDNYAPVQPNGNGGFYDDIFKIPISTLNAVNQLLNNNSG